MHGINTVKILVKLFDKCRYSVKAWASGRSLAGRVGSNPAGARLSVLSVVCCQLERSLRWADNSSRGVVPNCVCVCLCVSPSVCLSGCDRHLAH